MKVTARLLIVMALGAFSGVIGGAGPAWAKKHAPKAGPVVVELFTAQGCSSCKEANRLIARMAGRPGLIVLTWSVNYWDYLGWKDTFARPEFTDRQRAFGRRLGPQDVYTPQVVVNGRGQISGDDAAGVTTLIQTAGPSHGRQPEIRFASTGRVVVSAGAAPARPADVWLVRYDPREQDVEVKAGDNRGATVAHRNVVQEVVRLGAWRGHKVTFTPPAPSTANLATVVIVEAPRGGPILGAAEAARGKTRTR